MTFAESRTERSSFFERREKRGTAASVSRCSVRIHRHPAQIATMTMIPMSAGTIQLLNVFDATTCPKRDDRSRDPLLTVPPDPVCRSLR